MDPVPSDSVAESSSAASCLSWKKRARVVAGATHRRRIWESRCSWYRVVHSRCLYGPRKGRQAIPDVFYAMKLVVVSGRICWETISQHRKRGPAARACEQDAKIDRDERQACDHCRERPPTHFAVQTLFESNTQLCRRCWTHFRRYRCSRRELPSRLHSGTGRKLPLSPGQLSFAFSDETED